MVRLLERASRLTLDLLFPPQCALCGMGGMLLCHGCTGELVVADGERCDRCWSPVRPDGGCDDCRRRELALTSLRAAFEFDDSARRVVHLLKYDYLTSLAEPMAALMVVSLGSALASADVLVAVPLHSGRQRTRGFNQAELLAKHLGTLAGVGVGDGMLKRVRATKPLARGMGREQRMLTVRDAFRATPERVDGRRVMLVDDVATTGATLDACAVALRAAGAADVRAVTFARA